MVFIPINPGLPLDQLDFWATPGLAIVLLWLSLIDLRERRLPDRLSVPLIAAGLVLAAIRVEGLPAAQLLGAAAGYAVFALFGWAFFRLRGVEGLGLGDAKLLAAAGAWLGWQALPLVVLIGAVLALVAALLGARDRAHQLAFGPWLALGFAAVWGAYLLG